MGLCWLAMVGGINFSVIADVASLMWVLILLLASVSRRWISEFILLIWVLRASFTAWLICVSSISSSKKAMAQMALRIVFCTPGIAEIWCKQVARDMWVGGSPGGQSSESSSRYFLPSRESLTSWWYSTMVDWPVQWVFGLVAVFKFGLSGSLSDWFGGLFWMQLLEAWCWWVYCVIK